MSRLYTEGLSLAYGEQAIVENLDLRIPDERITAIIGANGCGKSTTLKALARVLSPFKGTVYLDGKEIQKEPTKQIAKKMAILPQTPVAPDGLTVAELVSYGRFPHQRGIGRLQQKDREVIEWALRVTGVAAFQEKPVDALSGGQRQRVWIAMALAQETDLILLDEPTTYLDLAHQLEVLELLQYLNHKEKRTIVMVIHDLNQAARFADHLVAMAEGKVIKEGSAQEVITPEVLHKVFAIDAVIATDPRTKKPLCLTYDLLPQNMNQTMGC